MKLGKTKAVKIYEEYLKSRGLQESTVKSKQEYALRFFDFLQTGKYSDDLRDVTLQVVLDYREHLNRLKNKINGKPLAEQTRQMILLPVKQMFSCLYLSGHILANPVQGLKQKRAAGNEKRAILSQEEMAFFLDNIEGGQTAFRDRVLFELMYSSGMRISEILRLKIRDIDFENRMVLVLRGKGQKDRVEPLNEVSVLMLKKFLSSRLQHKEQYVFMGRYENHLNRRAAETRFKKWIRAAGIKKRNLSMHSVRHSIAVHLLENGANVRYVQELLGHESIETTVIYTRASMESLKKVYKKCHPRENDYYMEIDEAYRERIKALLKRIREARS